jgi:hypothetical protein
MRGLKGIGCIAQETGKLWTFGSGNETALIDSPRHLLENQRVKDSSWSDIYVQGVCDPGDEAEDRDRITAQLEEVIERADRLDIQYFGPERG